MVYLPNNDEELTARLGGNTQFHGILTVNLKAIEKVKQRATGGYRVVGNLDAEEEVEEEEEEEDDEM